MTHKKKLNKNVFANPAKHTQGIDTSREDSISSYLKSAAANRRYFSKRSVCNIFRFEQTKTSNCEEVFMSIEAKSIHTETLPEGVTVLQTWRSTFIFFQISPLIRD